MKQVIIIIILLLIALGVFGWYQGWFDTGINITPNGEDTTDDESGDSATTTDNSAGSGDGIGPDGGSIGKSAGGREITAYRYGSGSTELLFVGGIHGGYSANTALVAFELMDWLEENPGEVPENVSVTVIPVLNPDGLNETLGTTGRFAVADIPAREDRVSGRFNANGVDLNRNFDCNWQSTGTWQSQDVNAGSQVFSEPESQALRDYVRAKDVAAAVVFYSAVGEVVASSCNQDALAETQQLVTAYASASGYTPQESFDYYEITGDAADWLAKEGVPAISVVLSTHNSAEWSKNRAGVQALLDRYKN
ncbi:MAG: M14 family metallopeptidase [Candidatus Paceibacterota bacterium]